MQICQEPLVIPGDVYEKREIPSDVALVTPLVVRVIEKLVEKGFLSEAQRMKTQLCLDEAVTNGVIHGNDSDFSKLVTVSLFEDEKSWGIVVSDEGDGFSLRDLSEEPSSMADDGLWNENGRGLPLLALYMDEVTYYDGGSSLLMRQYFKS
ncbi:MAG: ATP-binding protein [Planctomycetota bacterium]